MTGSCEQVTLPSICSGGVFVAFLSTTLTLYDRVLCTRYSGLLVLGTCVCDIITHYIITLYDRVLCTSNGDLLVLGTCVCDIITDYIITHYMTGSCVQDTVVSVRAGRVFELFRRLDSEIVAPRQNFSSSHLPLIHSK